VKALATCLIVVAACGSDDSIAPPPDGPAEVDPLASITSEATAGSLDDLYERIIAPRCSGQPGLCHNGQFEPNLSTPGLAYAYLVNRPGIEKADRLRVKPGDPAGSLFIDKIRNRNGVATQMPLGAEPLAEDEIAELEAWIDGGALRSPGADPAPVLNNPPRRPEIAIFDNTGTRLDGTGPVEVTIGSTLVLRHSVQDFETADSAIPFAAVVLSTGDGNDVVLAPGASGNEQLGMTTFDPAAPDGKGDKLNYKLAWTVPAQLPTRDAATGALGSRPAGNTTLSLLALYIDGAMPGIVAVEFSTTPIHIQ